MWEKKKKQKGEKKNGRKKYCHWWTAVGEMRSVQTKLWQAAKDENGSISGLSVAELSGRRTQPISLVSTPPLSLSLPLVPRFGKGQPSSPSFCLVDFARELVFRFRSNPGHSGNPSSLTRCPLFPLRERAASVIYSRGEWSIFPADDIVPAVWQAWKLYFDRSNSREARLAWSNRWRFRIEV